VTTGHHYGRPSPRGPRPVTDVNLVHWVRGFGIQDRALMVPEDHDPGALGQRFGGVLGLLGPHRDREEGGLAVDPLPRVAAAA
jgi:hypothetical protein